MKSRHTPLIKPLVSAGIVSLALGAPVALAANPCAAKNPCAASDKVDAELVTRPAGYKPYQADRAALLKEGEALWKDTKLGTSGASCNTCHANNNMFMPTFAQPYPHTVAMAKDKGGVKQVHLDEMVQFCMVVPMAAKPLPWDSRQLAALTAYTSEVQKKFSPVASTGKNPCGAQNPCAAKPSNPCSPQSGNPCAAKR